MTMEDHLDAYESGRIAGFTEAIEAAAKRLRNESEKRKEMAKATSTVNDGLLREIESSTFRWAAQLIEFLKSAE